VDARTEAWERERQRLLHHRISELGLSIRGTPIERLAGQLYDELRARGLSFLPPVYLTDEWGCPDGTPVIGVPFYLADERLARIEQETSLHLEDDAEVMRYLRHEAGHAYNYGFRLHDQAEWHRLFGPYSRPYRDRFRVDPLSRNHVRHILGWYAQKHPDEDFAETFAVWLTPHLDWRRSYEGWPVLEKLEYVDATMRGLRGVTLEVPPVTEDDLPVHAMTYTVADHYLDEEDALPLQDERHFDGDLKLLFPHGAGSGGIEAAEFLGAHRREVVARVAYWTGEPISGVRRLIDLLISRAGALGLRAAGREATQLIEVTAFATAVMMNFRYTHTYEGESGA
jgi:hypothetical protein